MTQIYDEPDDQSERNRVALAILKEFVSAIEKRKIPGLRRREFIQQFVKSLSESKDPSGRSFIQSDLVDANGIWVEPAAAMKYATAALLDAHPLELPATHQTSAARYLCGLRKRSGSPYVEFVFKTSGGQANAKSLAIHSDDYPFANFRALLPKLGQVRRAQLMLRTGWSAPALCEDLFRRKMDVEIHMQNPKMPFVSSKARGLIKSFCEAVGHAWTVNARGGSLRIYTSISVASLRAIRIDTSCVAMGWLPYKQRLSPKPTQPRPSDISVDTSSVPYIVANVEYEGFGALNAFFEHCLSLARETARKPVVNLGAPSHEV